MSAQHLKEEEMHATSSMLLSSRDGYETGFT